MERVHPQSEIENIGKYSCLVQCYIYCCGIAPNTLEYFKIILHAIEAGASVSGIAGDCTVEDAPLFLNWFTGKRWNVEKKVVCSINSIKGLTPVRYFYYDDKNKKHEHYVVVKDGEIIFNPLLNSNCVNKGRPDSARIITLAR